MSLRPVNDVNEEAPNVYANSVNLTMSVYDVTLHFAQATGPDPEDQREQVNVIMSPQHAKVMIQMLQENLDSYEKEIGDIALPKELKKSKIKK